MYWVRKVLSIIKVVLSLGAVHAHAQGGLTLLVPNGGEIFPAGSSFEIKWSGSLPTDLVRLEYTTDNGTSWLLIEDRVSGTSYPWRVPEVHSRSCRVRVTHIEEGASGDWAHSFPNAGYMVGDGSPIATDRAGNVFLTAAFSDSVAIGDTLLYGTNANGTDVLLAKFHPMGTVDWVKQITGDIYSHSVTTDAKGQVYVTGSFEGTASFDGQVLTSTGYFDVFVAKYSAQGDLIWARSALGTGHTSGVSLVVDAAENVYVVGYFLEELRFEDIVLNESGGCGDFFIAKYRSNGSVEWAKRGGGKAADYVFSVALDSSGDVYFTGRSEGPGEFEGQPISEDGFNSAFLIKCHPDATVAWIQYPQSKRFGANQGGWIYPQEVAIDKTGNSYLIGLFGTTPKDTVYFGSQDLVSSGVFDVFLAKYTVAGKLAWVQKVGAEFDDRGVSISIDPEDNIIANGYFTGRVQFGATDVTAVASRPDIFVAKFLPDGTVTWVKKTGGREKDQYSNVYDDRAGCIRADRFGNIYVTGFFTATSVFGPHTLKAQNRTDLFLWKIAPDIALASDTSDASFSIIMALPVAVNVDLGDVEIGNSRDSVFSSFLINKGAYHTKVGGIAINGGHSSDFQIISDFHPLTLFENEVMAVAFRFRPTATGPRTAQIAIAVDDDTLYQSITGTGLVSLGAEEITVSPLTIEATPNPASSDLRVTLYIPHSGAMSLSLSDLLGHPIATLYDGSISAGVHTLDINTSTIATGSYYLSLVTPAGKRFVRVNIIR